MELVTPIIIVPLVLNLKLQPWRSSKDNTVRSKIQIDEKILKYFYFRLK